MKTIVKRVLSIVLCISMLYGMIVVGDASNDRTLAEPTPYGESVNPNNKIWIGEYPDENTTLKTNTGNDIGTASNPFVVLEVVPELNQAQIGYFIPGCEPIDISAAEADYFNTENGHTSIQGALDAIKAFDVSADYTNKKCVIKNKDVFVQKIFGKSSYGADGFVSDVITITPEELGNRRGLIGEADLIYFHDATNQMPLRPYWYEYNRNTALRTETAASPVHFGDAGANDITNQTAIDIMRCMAGENPPALVFDGTKIGFESDEDIYNNIPKLKMMATMFKPDDFVNNLGLLDAVESNSVGKDKLYYPVKKRKNNGKLDKDKGKAVDDENKSLHWSVAKNINDPAKQGGTFAYDPTGEKVITDQMRYSGGNFTSNNVFNKIFCYDGSGVLFSELLDSNVKVNFSTSPDPLHGGAYNEDLVNYYKNQDPDKKDYTPLDVMKYILSVPQYKPFLNVLEIQPCQNFVYGNADFTMQDSSGKYVNKIDGKPAWVKYYEGLFPWYDSSQDSGKSWVTDTTRLKVTTMTTAEFVGNIGRYEYGQLDNLGNPIPLTYESSDDLIAKYDMVIFGAWQDASNGGNGYNDPLLVNGNYNLVYTAVGDLVYEFNNPSYQNAGNCPNKLKNRVRYSGTDITLKKMLELQDFLRAGKPIVVDQALYAKVEDNKYVVDTKKVDKSSKLYDLLTWDKEASKNIFRYGDYSGSEMKEVLAKSKCHLVFADDPEAYPLEYSYSTKDEAYGKDEYAGTATGVITHENYQTKDANGNAILKFHFYVSGIAGRKYQVRLNLDVDGDGVYRGSLKQHSEIDNMNEAMGYSADKQEKYDTAEVPLALTIYDNSEKELGNSAEVLLDEGKYYYATYELPKSRLGIVPWKLEVNDSENTCIRSSAIDYTAFSKDDEADKEPINVLQMCLPRNTVDKWDGNSITSNFIAFTCNSVDIGDANHQYFDPDYEYTSHDNPDFFNKLPSTGAKVTAKKFETYLDPVDEFNVHIQFLYNKDWYTMFGKNAKKPVIDSATGAMKLEPMNEQEQLAAWEDFLSQYDMIVLGFEDTNCFTTNKTFAEGFDDFVSQGKGVILSHDTVEGANADSGLYGKYAPWIRTLSGQRKAFYNRVDENGKTTYKKSYLTTYTNGYIIDDPSGEEDYKKYSNTALVDKMQKNELSGYIYPTLLADKKKWGHYFSKDTDFSSVEDEFLDGKHFVKEDLDNAAQLYANFGMDYNDGDRKRRDKTDRVIKSGTVYNGSWPDNNAGTSLIKLANNGQITTYPYLISPFITVANTHCQNYQLDMEYQVGGDVNVWFNLTDFGDPELATQTNKFVQDEINGTTKLSNKVTRIYSAKDQDSRNNFYIYNKGNITYTGSGHGTWKLALTDDEVKLFVNTMISAYRPPEDGPVVTIDNATSTSASENLLYVDYDVVRDSATDEVDNSVLDGNIVTDVDGRRMVKVEFTLKDAGVVVSDGTTGSSIGTSGGNNQQSTGTVTSGGVSTKTYYLSIKDSSGNNVLKSQIIPPSGVANPVETSNSEFMKGFVANRKYMMYIPYDELADKGQLKFTFTTYCKYKKVYRLKERAMRTTKNTTKLSVLVLPLFDLN